MASDNPALTISLSTLVGSSVGTWDYDVAQDRFSGCRVFAELCGIEPKETYAGVPIARIALAIHAEDLARWRNVATSLIERGGLFAIECRTVPTQADVRRVIGIGRYEKDASGRGIRGRGVIIDVTASPPATVGLAGPYDLTPGEMDAGTPLDRAAAHAVAVHRALGEMPEPERSKLIPSAEALLTLLGHQLAAMMLAATPRSTH